MNLEVRNQKYKILKAEKDKSGRQENKWIEEYNLPSYQWRKRRIRKGKDKRLIQLQKEYYKLRDIIFKLGYEELQTPIRKGYERLFVLREDVRYGKNPEFYQSILNKINTYRYNDTKSFKTKRKKKRISRHRYHLVEKKQSLLEPDPRLFKKLDFPDKEKRLFISVKYYDYPAKRWKEKYVFNEPWRFVLKVQPYYITRIRKRDWKLEQRQSEIVRIIYENIPNNHRLHKLHPRSNRWKGWLGEKNKYKLNPNPILNHPLSEIWETYKQELNYETSD